MADLDHQPYILGFDPGFSGALAVYEPAATKLIAVHDIPLLPADPLFGGKHRNYIDAKRLAAFVNQYALATRLAVVERVSAMPEQGVTSMFRFGEGYGIIQGILAAYQLKTLMPPPAVWKAWHSLSSDKELSLKRAREFWPTEAQQYFSRKKDNGRAEAALLAVYGAQALGLRAPTP